MLSTFDRPSFIEYTKPLVQVKGIVVIRKKYSSNKNYGYYHAAYIEEYKSVEERRNIITKLSEKYKVDNKQTVLSVIPN